MLRALLPEISVIFCVSKKKSILNFQRTFLYHIEFIFFDNIILFISSLLFIYNYPIDFNQKFIMKMAADILTQLIIF